MPYKNAHYWLIIIIAVTILGFWQSYFIKFNDVDIAFHFHAFTATVWVLLVMLQSWSIHNNKRDLHRTVGKLSIFIFPFLIVGFVMIINYSAADFLRADSEFKIEIAPSFGASMFFAIMSYLVLYYLALKHRAQVHLHAGYLLTTPLVLFESPFSRVMLEYFPQMVFTGSTGVRFILDAIVIGMMVSVIFAFIFYLFDRNKRQPFLVAAVLMSLSAVFMSAGSSMPWVRELFAAYAQLPPTVPIVVGFALGGFVAWWGWAAPSRAKKKAFTK